MSSPTSHASTSASADVSTPLVSRILASFSGLTFIVDLEGTILDVSVGRGLEEHTGWRTLVGKRWVDVAMIDSKGKVEAFLREAAAGHTSRSREMNLKVEGIGEIPFRFTGALLGEGRLIAFGFDIRDIANVQQRMVNAQQSMEMEYERVRQAEAPYRILFHVSNEGVLVAQGDRHVVVEANPSAGSILGVRQASLRGKPLSDLFEPESHEALSRLIASVGAGREHEATLRPAGTSDVEIIASATMFRQSGSLAMLFRFWPAGAAAAISARSARILEVIETMPDAFVVTDETLDILSANASFCELVEQATEAQVVGQSLDRWLGRPGVDLNIITSNLREHGLVRNFSTVIRGDFGAEKGATVAAVSAVDGKIPCLGFVIRPMITRALERADPSFPVRSAEQLQGLVGRVALKAIVKESADLIERLCIEVALDLSGNNRAAAAQLLGLSRQSLYSKLRRHGLEEFQPS